MMMMMMKLLHVGTLTVHVEGLSLLRAHLRGREKAIVHVGWLLLLLLMMMWRRCASVGVRLGRGVVAASMIHF